MPCQSSLACPGCEVQGMLRGVIPLGALCAHRMERSSVCAGGPR